MEICVFEHSQTTPFKPIGADLGFSQCDETLKLTRLRISNIGYNCKDQFTLTYTETETDADTDTNCAHIDPMHGVRVGVSQ